MSGRRHRGGRARTGHMRLTVRHDGRLTFSARLDPNGGHELIVSPDGGSSDYPFSRQQAAELRKGLDWFEARAAEADAGPDLLYPKIVKLED